MRKEFLVAVFGLSHAACVMEMAPGDDDGGGAGGWTAMPLVDDTSDPSRNVYHKGNDRVVGIHYDAPDKGWIVTQGAFDTSTRGGAVFQATGTTVEKVLFSGDNTGLTRDGGIEFTGLEKTPTGLVAMAHASDVIVSRDGGATFAIERNGNITDVEAVLGYKVTSSGTTIVHAGTVSTSTSAPGTSATYTDVWAPQSTPSIPATIPETMCQGGPLGTGRPKTRYSVHVAADRNFIAYTSNPGTYEPQLCISTDGGRSFTPRKLAVPASTDAYPPTGVTFTSATNGFAWFASTSAGTYLKRSTDGGSTWTDVALPAELASHGLELPAAFFASDGQHGWLAGYDATDGGALLIATTDGGASWTKVGGVKEAVEAAGGTKLYTVFALDADHVWLGGERGVILHN